MPHPVLFEPIRVGGRMWIVPSWHEPPDPAAINVLLDPGAAFGTGSHPTTRLCIAWLEGHVRNGDSVLDYGCGSGILAIAAMKLGAGTAIGVDVDPLALEAARYNAQRNAVAVEVLDAQATLAGSADIKRRNDQGLGPAAFARQGGREALAARLERLGG